MEVSNASINACLTAGSDRSVKLTTVSMRTTRAEAGEIEVIVTSKAATSPASARTVPSRLMKDLQLASPG
jgi:hypothetical protein